LFEALFWPSEKAFLKSFGRLGGKYFPFRSTLGLKVGLKEFSRMG